MKFLLPLSAAIDRLNAKIGYVCNLFGLFAVLVSAKSSDIYWGALPWVGLQLVMVLLVIAFPITVTFLLDKPISAEDIGKVKIEIPMQPPLQDDLQIQFK